MWVPQAGLQAPHVRCVESLVHSFTHSTKFAKCLLCVRCLVGSPEKTGASRRGSVRRRWQTQKHTVVRGRREAKHRPPSPAWDASGKQTLSGN